MYNQFLNKNAGDIFTDYTLEKFNSDETKLYR